MKLTIQDNTTIRTRTQPPVWVKRALTGRGSVSTEPAAQLTEHATEHVKDHATEFLPYGRLARRWAPLPRGRMARGAALLETVVVLMLLLTLSFGMAEFSYAFFVKNTMEAAVREGARAGIVSGANTSDVQAAVARQLQAAGLQTSLTTVDTARFNFTPPNPAGVIVGGALTVTLQLRRWDVMPAGVRPMSTMLGSTSPLRPDRVITASAVMRKEG